MSGDAIEARIRSWANMRQPSTFRFEAEWMESSKTDPHAFEPLNIGPSGEDIAESVSQSASKMHDAINELLMTAVDTLFCDGIEAERMMMFTGPNNTHGLMVDGKQAFRVDTLWPLMDGNETMSIRFRGQWVGDWERFATPREP